MIPAPVTQTLTHSHGSSELATMTSRLDPEAARRLMDMLVNAYADPILAVARELVSNGIDATRRAGSGLPVQITSPSVLEPTLIVTDRGTGMSLRDVEMAFLAFAASTKRESNEEIGGLGIGAKSPWAVSDSFLVDTVKDGRRTIVRASRDLEHQVLMAGEPSDLPSGTSISVPIGNLSSKRAEWHRAIIEVAIAHEPGAVLVDGAEVPSLVGPARIGPVLCASVEHRSDSVLIRSGGTLFESVYDVRVKVNKVVKLKACIIELPIGSFDHTPSRESVTSTPRTLAAIDKALTEYGAAYAAVKAELNLLAKTDVTAAVKRREEILGNVGSFDTLPIDLNLEVPDTIGAWVCGSSWKKVNRDRDPNADKAPDVIAATSWARDAKNTVLVTGVPDGKKLARFATYLKERYNGAKRVIPIPVGATSVALNVTDKPGQLTGQTFTVTTDMVPADNVYTWETWLEVTTAHLGGGGSRGPRSGYSCVLIAADGSKTSDNLTTKEIAALGVPVWYTQDEGRYGSIPAPVTAESVGVHLGKRKIEPFLKAVPAAMPIRKWNEKCLRELSVNWPAGTWFALAADASYHDKNFALVTEARQLIVANGGSSTPLLDQAAGIVNAIALLTNEQREVWKLMAKHGASNNQHSQHLDSLWQQLEAAWPLLDHYRPWNSSRKDRAAFLDYLTNVPPRT
jgi:hypothetical protein